MRRSIESATCLLLVLVFSLWMVADRHHKRGLNGKTFASAMTGYQMAAKLAPWDATFSLDYMKAMVLAGEALRSLPAKKATMREHCREALRFIRLHPSDFGGHYSLAGNIYESAKLGMRFADGGMGRARIEIEIARRLNPHHEGVKEYERLIVGEMGRSANVQKEKQDQRRRGISRRLR